MPKKAGPAIPAASTPNGDTSAYHLLPTRLSAGQAKQYIAELTEDPWERDMPSIMLWGGPGVGKSSISEQLTLERGWGFIDIRLTQVQLIDVVGLPYIERIVRDGEIPDAVTRFARSVFLPTRDKSRWIIMLDELVSATPAIQTQAYQLMSEHRAGPHVLDPGVHVIAAGNRSTDKGVVYRMPSPLVNRCVHIEIEPHIDDWLDYMMPRGVAPEVVAYLRRYPQRLLELHADIDTIPFPSPRSWTYTSRILLKYLARYPREAALARVRPLIEGLIGPGVANDFLLFLRVFHEIPDPETIIDGLDSPEPPSDPDALYALTSSLVGLTRTRRDLTHFLRYILKLPKTFAVLAVRDAFRAGQEVRDRLTSSPVWPDVAHELKHDIIMAAAP